MRRATTEIDFQALAELRYQIRRFLSFSENAARSSGIEPQQHQALLAIKAAGNGEGATIGVLAERLQIRHHSAVELANRLESRRLVARSRNGPDRRQVHLRLSARGERILGALSRAHGEELRSMGPQLVKALNAAIRSEHRSDHRSEGASGLKRRTRNGKAA